MKTYAFPGIIEPEILEIGAEQIPYMRTTEFSEINKNSEKLLLEMIGAPAGSRTIIYTGSGTGAMDAVVSGYVSTKKKAFIIDGGSFGHRWGELCRYYTLPHEVFSVEFGKDIDYESMEKALDRSGADVFLCQHHETSSGALYDLERIGKICRERGVVLIADVISSFLAEPLSMQKFHIDIAITSSQKGLNIPPGLSILFLSPEIVGHRFAARSYYFDFANNLGNLSRGQTPFSPATTIYLQLNRRLQQLTEEGIEHHIARTADRSAYFKALCKEHGWPIPAEHPSAAITGFRVRRNGDRICRALIEEKQIYIMPSAHPGFFRVSHMGVQSREELLELSRYIQEIEAR